MPEYYYSVRVDGPGAHELLEHVVRASHHDAHLYVNGHPLDADLVKKLSMMVRDVIPDLYLESLEVEERIRTGEMERRCGTIGRMKS